MLNQAGTLIGKPAGEIVGWAVSDVLAEAAVGMATVNALLSYSQNEYEFLSGDIFKHAVIKDTDRAALIGYIPPIYSGLKERAGELFVFEHHSMVSLPELVPEENMTEVLKSCDVVIFTGSTCINKSIDRILEESCTARIRAMVGPSTPLCPEVMGKYGIHLLCGAIIFDIEKATEVVSQGGGTCNLRPCIKKISLPTYD